MAAAAALAELGLSIPATLKRPAHSMDVDEGNSPAFSSSLLFFSLVIALLVPHRWVEESVDLYDGLKSVQRQLEFLVIQEEYIKDEQKNLKREILRAQQEIQRIQSVPLVIGQFLEMIDQEHAIVSSTSGHTRTYSHSPFCILIATSMYRICPCFIDARSRIIKAQYVSCAPPLLQFSSWHLTVGSGFRDYDDANDRETGCKLCRYWGHGHSEAGN